MKDKIKEAVLWGVAIFVTTAVVVAFWGGIAVVAFWGGIAVVVMDVAHYLGGE